jgi:hypothetical protein
MIVPQNRAHFQARGFRFHGKHNDVLENVTCHAQRGGCMQKYQPVTNLVHTDEISWTISQLGFDAGVLELLRWEEATISYRVGELWTTLRFRAGNRFSDHASNPVRTYN